MKGNKNFLLSSFNKNAFRLPLMTFDEPFAYNDLSRDIFSFVLSSSFEAIKLSKREFSEDPRGNHLIL